MDKRVKTDDKFIGMTQQLITCLRWLERHNLADGDMEEIHNYMLFGKTNGYDSISYKKYIECREFFLDSYESDKYTILMGNDWYDIIVEMYKSGYEIHLTENKISSNI